MFLTRIRIGAALLLLAGCIAWGAVDASRSKTPAGPARGPRRSAPTAEATGKHPAGHRGAPAYVRRSRTMIVERLEQELNRTEGQLAEVTARTRSAENDAVALHLRKTVAKLAGLLDRIDPVLADAVNEFPTIFDFTTPRDVHTPPAEQKDTVAPIPASRTTKPAEPAATPPYDEHSLATAAERVEWSRKMNEKGYVSNAERDRYQKEYEALKARIDTDLARAADRVDWARRMFEKGYVTKRQYDAEILKHYEALQARTYGEPTAVTDELLERYELLKAKVEKSARTTPSDPNLPAPETETAKPAKKSGTDVRGKASRDKLPPTVDADPATDDNANRDRDKLPPAVDATPAAKPGNHAPALLIQPASGANGSVGRPLILACSPPCKPAISRSTEATCCVVASTLIAVSVT